MAFVACYVLVELAGVPSVPLAAAAGALPPLEGVERLVKEEAGIPATLEGSAELAEAADAQNTMDFEEYLRCVAFCGMTFSRDVKEMSAADKRKPKAQLTADTAELGDWVVAMGHPGGSGG